MHAWLRMIARVAAYERSSYARVAAYDRPMHAWLRMIAGHTDSMLDREHDGTIYRVWIRHWSQLEVEAMSAVGVLHCVRHCRAIWLSG